MNRCSTCKHWQRGRDDSGDDIESDYMNKIAFMGFCASPKTIYMGQDSSSYAKDVLGYYDYEGAAAGVITGEDFGCINHESK